MATKKKGETAKTRTTICYEPGCRRPATATKRVTVERRVCGSHV